MLKNAAGTTSKLQEATLGSDMGANGGSPPAGWSVTLAADSANDCLDIAVQGSAGTTINWVAQTLQTEVKIT